MPQDSRTGDTPLLRPVLDSNDSQRHTIFAPLNTVKGNVDCRILLTNGGTTFDFQVTDGFCLNGDASFILPDPDPNNDGVAEYQVWVELAGKPGGGANLTTCQVDATGIETCSTENRDPGKPKWVNVTKQLLTVCLDTDGDKICDTRAFLFDNSICATSMDSGGVSNTPLRAPGPRYFMRS